MAKKGTHQKRHTRTSKKGKIYRAGKKAPLGKRIKTIATSLFLGVAPTEFREATEYYETYGRLLKQAINELDQEKHTTKRPSEIKRLKKEVSSLEKKRQISSKRLEYVSKKHGYDFKTVVKLFA